MASLTPEQYRDKLALKLAKRLPAVQQYEDYYNGKQPLAFATSKFREAFGSVFQSFADNLSRLVVDASADRLKIVGFQYEEQDHSDAARKIWRANNMTGKASIAHLESIKTGAAYVMVDPWTPVDGMPRITIERASQMITDNDPSDPSTALAAYRQWADEDMVYGTLLLPDYVYKWEAKKPTNGQSKINWQVREEPFRNDLGVVPVIELANAAGFDGGISDLADVLPLQDMVNKSIMDMLVASEYTAYPQRVITGIEIPRDPATGKPLADLDLQASVSRYLTFKNSEVKVEQLEQGDLGNYKLQIETAVQQIAMLTRTPPQMLMLSSLSNVNTDTLMAIENNFNHKLKRKQEDFGAAWERAISLALTAMGLAKDYGSTTWARTEYQSLAQTADAAQKQTLVGVPYEVVQESVLGYTPEQVASFAAIKAAGATQAVAAQAQTAQELDQPTQQAA